jgi:hypothetical protein
MCSRLRSSVAAIDEEVGGSGIAGCVAGQVQESALELLGHALTAQGDLALPEVVCLLGNEVGDLRGHVARRDGVGASELGPFNGKRLDCPNC